MYGMAIMRNEMDCPSNGGKFHNHPERLSVPASAVLLFRNLVQLRIWTHHGCWCEEMNVSKWAIKEGVILVDLKLKDKMQLGNSIP